MDTVHTGSGDNRGLMAAGSALANISGPDGIELRTTAFRANKAMGYRCRSNSSWEAAPAL